MRVEGDRIVDVGVDGQRLASPDDVPRFDAAGRTLMPGLIDAHVHAAITKMDIGSMNHRPLTRIGIEAKAILEGMLRRGFTTVRDAGGMDRGLKEAAEAGLIAAPRIFRSGRVLSQTGGHGDTAAPSNHPRLCACGINSTGFAHVADGPDAVRRAAREELKGGADQIKVMAGGGVASPNDPIDMTQYTEGELRAAVEEAASRRTYAMAHAYIPESIVRAARAGIRSIEHGNLLDAESARVMAEHGCFLVPTLVTYDQIAEFGEQLGFPDESMRKLDAVLSAGTVAIQHRARRRRARRASAPTCSARPIRRSRRSCCCGPRCSRRSTSCGRRRSSTPSCWGRSASSVLSQPAPRPTSCSSTVTRSPTSACSAGRASTSTSSPRRRDRARRAELTAPLCPTPTARSRLTTE